MKQEVLQQVITLLQHKIDSYKEQMQGLQDSLANETKSSAGDKYETGASMLQQELDKLQEQIAISNKHFYQLKEFLNKKNDSISAGALAKVNGQWMLFGISLGLLKLDNFTLLSTGFSAPLAQALLQQKMGAEVEFRGVNQRIEEIH